MNTIGIQRIFAAFLLVTICAHYSWADAPTDAPATQPVTTIANDYNFKHRPDGYRNSEKRVAAMKGKPCDIIFIGDSITQGWTDHPTPTWDEVGITVWNKYYSDKNALNFGVASDGTEHLLYRLENIDLKGLNPKVAVVMIGTNDNTRSPPEIAAGVAAVLKKTEQTLAGVKIILISILPNARATQKMADANEIIRTLADDKTVFYLDLAAKMPREGDNWKGIGRDHLHLSPAGYEIWAGEMAPLLAKLLESGQ